MNDGHEFPLFGLGTYQLKDKDAFKNALINHKYRLIDTASHYHNEEYLGQGLSEIFRSGKLQRKDLFITTKLWID